MIYTVHLAMEVSTAVTVEADSVEDAIAAAYDSDDMPGSMVHGAFGSNASVDESAEWTERSVTDASTGEELWRA